MTTPISNPGENLTIESNTHIHFNASNSTDNIGIANYTWEFFYNETSVNLYGLNPGFKFEIPGTYTINLKIEDAEGNFGNNALIITVKPIDVNVSEDDMGPTDDDIYPVDDEEDKGSESEIAIWVLILQIILTIAVLVILSYIVWNRRKSKVEQSFKDEFRRMKKEERN